MDIIFIVDDLQSEHLGIMAISAVLKKAGYNICLAGTQYSSLRNMLLGKTGLTVLAYSVTTFSVDRCLKLNQKIKSEFNVFSVFGGPHPTFFPEMINFPRVDGICMGEGEWSFLELLDNMKQGKPIHGIENWWIKEDDRIHKNPMRPHIDNLDSLPFPDRGLFRLGNDVSAISVSASRGCLFNCSYCCEKKSAFYWRSVDNVITELKEVISEKDVKFVYFVDSTFNFSPKWLKDFSDRYRKEIGIPFFCFIRADLIDEDIVKCLEEAGCEIVSMSIETANDYLRNDILNKGLSREDILRAAGIIKRSRIKLRITNMVGIPMGTLDDDIDTLKLNIKCSPDYVRVYDFVVYNGTDINSIIGAKNNRLPEDYRGYYHFYEQMSVREARRVQNLRDIFCIIVRFPFLVHIVRPLLGLPIRPLFSGLSYLWMLYYHIKSKHKIWDLKTV